jgi:hypothetical protein
VQGKQRWRKEKVEKQKIKHSNTYTNKVDKKSATPYLLKKKNDKVVAHEVNKQYKGRWINLIWVSKKIIFNMKRTKNIWVLKEKFSPLYSRNMETWSSLDVWHGVQHIG